MERLYKSRNPLHITEILLVIGEDRYISKNPVETITVPEKFNLKFCIQ